MKSVGVRVHSCVEYQWNEKRLLLAEGAPKEEFKELNVTKRCTTMMKFKEISLTDNPTGIRLTTLCSNKKNC